MYTESMMPSQFMDAANSTHSDDYPDPHASSLPSRARVSRAYNIQTTPAKDLYTIPPPITKSVSLSSQVEYTSGSPARSVRWDASTNGAKKYSAYKPPGSWDERSQVLALRRQEKSLQSELQALLDAQSYGLVDGKIADDVNEDGLDRSPNASYSASVGMSPLQASRAHQHVMSTASRRSGVIPVSQPKPRMMSLKSARKGIRNALVSLADVKAREQQIIASAQSVLVSAQAELARWQSKINGFNVTIKQFDQNTDNQSISSMKQEQSSIRSEMQELRKRLAALQSRDSTLTREILEIDSRRDAQLSSFKTGKSDVELQITKFLAQPERLLRDTEELVIELAATQTMTKDASRPITNTDRSIELFQAPSNSRTLDMANAYIATTMTLLNNISKAIEKEIEALSDGEKIWTDTITHITTFEESMKASQKSKDFTKQTLNVHLKALNVVLDTISANLEAVERDGWNLLVCAIGAEVEAFKLGQTILNSVLEAMTEGMTEGQGDTHDDQQAPDSSLSHSDSVTSSTTVTKSQCLRDQYRAQEMEDRDRERLARSSYHSAREHSLEDPFPRHSLADTERETRLPRPLANPGSESEEDGDNLPPEDLLGIV